MPSPFPGMNPYIEHPEVWHDFHERFMPRAADALSAQLGSEYVVKIDEHVYVHAVESPDERSFLGRADIALTQRSAADNTSRTTATLDPPLELVPANLSIEEERDCYVEIRDRRNRELVTVIELLSPANKTGTDRQQYLAKRQQLLRGAINLVEIDLLRAGERLPYESLPACDYCVLVSRASRSQTAGCWPLTVRDRLPEIPIPLKAGRDDARLDLQHLLDQIHDAARYADYIYENEISPPLTTSDAHWVAERMAARKG